MQDLKQMTEAFVKVRAENIKILDQVKAYQCTVESLTILSTGASLQAKKAEREQDPASAFEDQRAETSDNSDDERPSALGRLTRRNAMRRNTSIVRI